LSYDALGCVASSTEQVGTNGPYAFVYTHNLAGGLLTEQYPSGRLLTTSYNDGLNRPTGIAAAAATYVNSVSYASNGAMSEMRYGPASGEIARQTVTFDQGQTTLREQPTNVTVTTPLGTPLALSYAYCPASAESQSNRAALLQS
jgi:hypothetical protein